MPTDQPSPKPTDGPSMWAEVIADMYARDRLGRSRYGTPVQAHNGRNSLRDLNEELLDAVVYLRQLRTEMKDLGFELTGIVERYRSILACDGDVTPVVEELARVLERYRILSLVD